MSNDLNQVTFTGRLGKDPETRRLNSGDSVVNFSLAVGKSWRDKNSGERKEKTEWVNVSCFNQPLVKIIEQYVKKGSRVLIQGEQQTRKWQDQNGNDRYSTECVLGPFGATLIMLDGRQQGEDRGGGDYDRGGQGDRRDDRRSDDRVGRATGMTREQALGQQHPVDDDIPF